MTRIAYSHRALSFLTAKPLGNKGPKWGTVHTMTVIQCIFLRVRYITLVVSVRPACCGSVFHVPRIQKVLA